MTPACRTSVVRIASSSKSKAQAQKTSHHVIFYIRTPSTFALISRRHITDPGNISLRVYILLHLGLRYNTVHPTPDLKPGFARIHGRLLDMMRLPTIFRDLKRFLHTHLTPFLLVRRRVHVIPHSQRHLLCTFLGTYPTRSRSESSHQHLLNLPTSASIRTVRVVGATADALIMSVDSDQQRPHAIVHNLSVPCHG